MGWLCNDSTPAASSAQERSSAQPTHTSATPPPPPADSSKPPTNEGDDELSSFLKELDADINPSSTKYNRVPRDTPTFSRKSRVPKHADGTPESLGEQLLPTTMSCRTAFDEAFYCNSFGGRWNDLYRYGTLKSCSDNWNDFWFCMRTRTWSEREKENAIKEHYREKENRKYAKELGRESSEDVWRSRERKVEVGEAFALPFPRFEGDDEEWRRQELEARKGGA